MTERTKTTKELQDEIISLINKIDNIESLKHILVLMDAIEESENK